MKLSLAEFNALAGGRYKSTIEFVDRARGSEFGELETGTVLAKFENKNLILSLRTKYKIVADYEEAVFCLCTGNSGVESDKETEDYYARGIGLWKIKTKDGESVQLTDNDGEPLSVFKTDSILFDKYFELNEKRLIKRITKKIDKFFR